MGSAGTSKVLLHVLNGIHCVISLGLLAASLWFFVQVKELTSLRNSNHYLLDYNVYWPQAIPWIFFIVSSLAFAVTCLGFMSVKKGSKGLLYLFMILLSIVILLLVGAAIISLVCADNENTDKFVRDTVWDVYFQTKVDPDTADAFGNIEKKLHCCGAESPRDYINWKTEFPTSCCDVFYHGWLEPYSIDCDFTNKLANERHGCSTVASQYARITIKVFSGVAIFMAFIAIISLVVSFALTKALKKRPQRVITAQYQAESEKVLI